jgi:hypothetical protein
MLCAELAGTKDPELTQLLAKRFRESSAERDLRIRQLFLVGSTEVASELLAEFRAAHPQPQQPDIQQLLAVLSEASVGRELTIDEINRRILLEKPNEEMPDKAFINPNHQVRVALELAGLRSEVGMLENLTQQLAAFSEMARGEFDVDLVHIDARTNAVFFCHQDSVVQYEVPYPEQYQYPLVESAIANAVLKHFGVANRFVAGTVRDTALFLKAWLESVT